MSLKADASSASSSEPVTGTRSPYRPCAIRVAPAASARTGPTIRTARNALTAPAATRAAATAIASERSTESWNASSRCRETSWGTSPRASRTCPWKRPGATASATSASVRAPATTTSSCAAGAPEVAPLRRFGDLVVDPPAHEVRRDGEPVELTPLEFDVHMANLRRKLGDDPQNPRYIRTVRGVGYRMGSGA